MEKHKWFVPGFLHVFIVSSFLIFSSFLIIIPGEGVKASNPSVSAFKQDNSIQFIALNPHEVTKQHVSSQTTEQKQNQKRIQVIPGGQSIGVQLHTKGVLVVGHHLVEGEAGSLSPGEDALIQVGDMIIEMNGKIIETMSDVKPIVEQAGESATNITVILRRNDKDVETVIQPVLDKQENFQIGLYIRDSAAGIGTMSFYDPKSKKYGALGHVISDVDTQKPVETYEGSIVRSSVTSISKGNNGIPGEKKARFSIEENKLGTVNKNSPFGIFGTLDHPIKNKLLDEPMDVAFQDEVKKGPATILTVLENELVEQFDIEIVSSARQDEPETKGMVIKITDERLLAKTGGVVQGMSGSPIIQNNKIIGAVTHVFVNDPTSGYGVHIEWMLEDAEIIPSKIKMKAS